MKTKIVNHNGFNIEYFENDAMASNSIGLNKKWEAHILEFVKTYKRLVGDISNIVDVGANFGYHTLFFSSVVDNGFVFAFEPQAQNFKLLSNNIEHNKIKNVKIFNEACSDVVGKVYLPKIETTELFNMGNFTPVVISGSRSDTIPSIPLDSHDLPKIDLIKIDVQGWEVKVLSGAINLINRDKPVLIVEFEEHQLRKCGITCSQLASIIEKMGYYIFYLDYDYPSDHVCIHRDRLHEFEEKFKDYIFKHDVLNQVNSNINFGINKKIKIQYKF